MRVVRYVLLALLILVSLPVFLQAQQCPTIVVIIPEEVIIHEIPRQVPDPAAETAIIGNFLDYGFHVVDQDQVRAIRYQQVTENAINGQRDAILKLSNRFAADILVLGEAFAEEDERPVTTRLDLQPARARVELRAIEADSAKILAAKSLHTGGVDFNLDTAAKRSLERAGEEIAGPLAKDLKKHLPSGCVSGYIPSRISKTGVLDFENESGARVYGWNVERGLAKMVETALSKKHLKVVRPIAADIVVTGTITNWKRLISPLIQLPILDWFIRVGTMRMTVDARIIDLRTSEIKGDVISASTEGFEIFGIKIGLDPRDLARKISRRIASRMASLARYR